MTSKDYTVNDGSIHRRKNDRTIGLKLAAECLFNILRDLIGAN